MNLNLKQKLQNLYEGESVTAHRFRYVLLGLDVATLVFLVLSSFYYGHPAVDWAEWFFGTYILIDFLARLYIAPNEFKFLTTPFIARRAAKF